MLLTRKNGGTASLKEVAESWKKEAHVVDWSDSELDHWAVEFAKKLQAADREKGPARPDPRNIHPG